MLRGNQKISVELNQKLISAESDVNIYKEDLANLFKDFETRYEYFQQVTQTDASNMIKMQKETNKNLESFMTMVNKRTTSIEESLKDRMDSYHALIQQISSRELNDECFKPLNEQVGTLTEKLASAEKKMSSMDNRVSNFRNEVNTLLLDYESDVNNKWSELSSAVGSLAKQSGVRNPLLT